MLLVFGGLRKGRCCGISDVLWHAPSVVWGGVGVCVAFLENGMKGHTIRVIMSAILVAGLGFGAVDVQAQDANFETKKEAQIKGATERKATLRQTLDELEGKGPKLGFETDEMAAQALEAEKIDLQASAIKKLKTRIKQTDDDDPAKPELMERLGDMLWQQGKYYELRAFDKLNEARKLQDAGQKDAANKMHAAQKADEKTARDSRTEMLSLYKDIIKYFPDYKQIDKVQYYLAFNLAEMGMAGEAYEHYSGIVRDHSNSPYLADAFLGMAEYTFTIEEDMPLALQQYQKVVSIDPKSSAASFAMYKMGWCYFNLGEPKKALAQFELVIKEADAAKGNQRRGDMRKEALKDLVKAYSMWTDAKPGNARKYFSKFTSTEQELNDMMERLARMYAEDGQTDNSNFVYNELIAKNPGKFAVVRYQHEIMLNIETENNPEKLAQELNRTVMLFVKARKENYSGATPEEIQTEYNKLEEYARETGKWYHQTYQTTKNPLYYSLAFEIYKAYLESFPEAKDNYEIMYYYADMAYFRKSYAIAAASYDRVLDINEKGEFSKDAAHGAVLAYHELIKTADEASCPAVPELAADAPPAPIAECRIKFIEASKRYSKIDTSEDYAINSKYEAAKIYYDYNHLDEAAPLFKEITQENPKHSLAIYSANLLLDIYNMKKDYEGMWEAIKELKANKDLMTNPDPATPELVALLNGSEEQLAFKMCEQKEQNKLWEAAATCYEGFAKNYPQSADAAKAMWNASQDWENASEVGRAIEARVQLLTGKESEASAAMAPRAMYAIAQNYHGIAVFTEAARFYEMFVKNFPNDYEACMPIGEKSKDPCAKSALQNAAAFRSGLGEYEKAVEDYDLFARMYPKDKNEMSLLKFNTGRIYFDQKEYDKAIDRFNDYLRNYAKFGPAGRKVAAQTAIGRSYWRKKDYRSAQKTFEKAEQTFEERGLQSWLKTAEPADVEVAMDAGAEARFMRGESVFSEAMAVQLYNESISPKNMDNHLKQQINKKLTLVKEAQPIYNDVINRFASPRWGLASLVRLGMLNHDIANQIGNAPIPKQLTEEQSLIYEDILLEFASKFEEEAIQYYVFAVQKAAETGWFSEYTTEAQKRLFDLRPLEYRSASEIKAQPNKAVVTWQTAKLYNDMDELRGKVVREKRKVISEQDMQNVEKAAADHAKDSENTDAKK